MNSSFENKVALVTGAASGMGLATAKAFAEAGAAVALRRRAAASSWEPTPPVSTWRWGSPARRWGSSRVRRV